MTMMNALHISSFLRRSAMFHKNKSLLTTLSGFRKECMLIRTGDHAGPASSMQEKYALTGKEYGPCQLTRRSRGGSATAAIFASALFGTISGSAPASVYGTGTFTIPLVKRVGYSPSLSGAVEAADAPRHGGSSFHHG